MLKQLLLGLLKSHIVTWLTDRALKLPQSERAKLIAQKIPAEHITAIEQALHLYAVSQIDKI